MRSQSHDRLSFSLTLREDIPTAKGHIDFGCTAYDLARVAKSDDPMDQVRMHHTRRFGPGLGLLISVHCDNMLPLGTNSKCVGKFGFVVPCLVVPRTPFRYGRVVHVYKNVCCFRAETNTSFDLNKGGDPFEASERLRIEMGKRKKKHAF